MEHFDGADIKDATNPVSISMVLPTGRTSSPVVDAFLLLNLSCNAFYPPPSREGIQLLELFIFLKCLVLVIWN